METNLSLIKEKDALSGRIKRFAALEVKRKEQYHRLFVSLLHYTARTRNPGMLNDFLRILNNNDRTAARNYVMNFQYQLDDDNVFKKDENGELVPTEYAFLGFETRTGFVVLKHTVEASNAFMPFAEEKLIIPSEAYPNFLDRINVKDEKAYGVADVAKVLATALSKYSKQSDADSRVVVELTSAVEKVKYLNDVITREDALPSADEQKYFDEASAEIEDATIADDTVETVAEAEKPLATRRAANKKAA